MRFLLFALLVPTLTFSQRRTTTDAPKGSNVIVVKGVDYMKCLHASLDSGYMVANHDDSLKIFSTQPQTDKKNNLTYQFFVRIKDSVAYVTGEWQSNIQIRMGMVASTNEKLPIMVKGWRTGGYIPNWIRMEDFAKAFGGQLSFLAK